MIAIASILNPIKFFTTVQEDYWQTPAKNGPDRGNFFRYIPTGVNFNLYFSADAAIAFVDLKRCSDNSIVGSFVVISLGSGNYSCVVNIGAPSVGNVYLQVRGSAPDVRSEQFRVVSSTSPFITQQTLIQYRNVKAFAGIPSNTLLATYLNISFWMQKNPQTYEDIEIAPGEFTRLTNEVHRTLKLELDYSPAYLHEFLQVVLGLDYVFINGKEWIMRNDYMYDFPNKHFALAKGQCELTERKSILRNTI